MKANPEPIQTGENCEIGSVKLGELSSHEIVYTHFSSARKMPVGG
jgi:hypothetical protein